ncbi:MAG: phosphate acyltransferase PlsX [bacterium]|nr:phosphate acyltransferase PlsX [bacterium]
MRIAIDTLGGQHAPDAIVEGALSASKRWDHLRLTLVGDPVILKSLVDRFDGDASRITIKEGPGLIAEGDSPVEALASQPDASIMVALDLLRRAEVEAVVSAGSTGAQIVASIRMLGLLEGVLRPAIGSYFPTTSGRSFIIDVGANISCRPIHLLQFAAMGALFRQHADGIVKPKIGLLSVGEESSKGTEIIREAHELMQIVPQLNFIGNIEGNDIFSGKADVIICDGLLGNVLLKFAESIPLMLNHWSKEIPQSDKECSSILNHLVRSFDYEEFGGVPLLGVNGVSMICHGHSSSKAIKNAIGEAIKMVNLRVNEQIREQLTTMGHWSAMIKTRALLHRFRRWSAGDKT